MTIRARVAGLTEVKSIPDDSAGHTGTQKGLAEPVDRLVAGTRQYTGVGEGLFGILDILATAAAAAVAPVDADIQLVGMPVPSYVLLGTSPHLGKSVVAPDGPVHNQQVFLLEGPAVAGTPPVAAAAQSHDSSSLEAADVVAGMALVLDEPRAQNHQMIEL